MDLRNIFSVDMNATQEVVLRFKVFDTNLIYNKGLYYLFPENKQMCSANETSYLSPAADNLNPASAHWAVI